MQAEVFADKENFRRIFRNNAQMSAMGIVRIAAIVRACVAGDAYLPMILDEAFIVEGNRLDIPGSPYLVKSSIGKDIDAESLGGARHTYAKYPALPDNKIPG